MSRTSRALPAPRVIPAKAGIQIERQSVAALDSRFRGNDRGSKRTATGLDAACRSMPIDSQHPQAQHPRAQHPHIPWHVSPGGPPFQHRQPFGMGQNADLKSSSQCKIACNCRSSAAHGEEMGRLNKNFNPIMEIICLLSEATQDGFINACRQGNATKFHEVGMSILLRCSGTVFAAAFASAGTSDGPTARWLGAQLLMNCPPILYLRSVRQHRLARLSAGADAPPAKRTERAPGA